MRIALLTPADDRKRSRSFRLGGWIYGGRPNPQTGPLLLGTVLRDAGHQVAVFEELYRDVDLRELEDFDLIGLSVITSTAPRSYALAQRFRRLGKRVLMGGLHPSALPEEASEHADQVIVGEAEPVVVDAVEGRLRQPIVRSPAVEDLDALPFADYDLLRGRYLAANVFTARGCPRRCIFCTTSRMFAPYRQRGIADVLAELQALQARGFRYVYFQDDDFAADPERAKELLRAMIRRGLVFRESFFFGRVEVGQDSELLDLLGRANFNRMLLGVESLNPAALEAVGKRQSPGQIVACCEALRSHGIKLIVSLVNGLDADGLDDLRRAVRLARRVDAYGLQPALLTPFPGTPVRSELEAQGRLLDMGWEQYDLTRAVFEPARMSAWELQKQFMDAISDFYTLRGAWRIWRRFGWEPGLRRAGMCLAMAVGTAHFRLLALLDSRHPYGRLWRQHRARASSPRG